MLTSTQTNTNQTNLDGQFKCLFSLMFSYSREQSIKTLHVAAFTVTASVYTAEIYHILFIIEHSYPIQTYE